MEIRDTKSGKIYSIDTRRLSGEEQMTCPICSAERKKKTAKCFSFNHDSGLGRCAHCEASFTSKKEFIPKKEYVRPAYINSTELSQKAVDWFFSRGIRQHTLTEFKISTAKEFMPQTGKEENAIRFPYYRDNDIISVKYRDGAKNFKLSKDAELIFYNINAIKEAKECVICEGEIDALSFHEAGYKMAVSVPNGASKNGKLEYLDNCWEYFENKEKIYLASDNDEVGIALRNELARRLGVERCFIVDFNDVKDANECLVKHNEETLLALIQEARPFPLEGVFTINDVWAEIENIYENGLPKGDRTGDTELDLHIGFMPGEITLVTGIPGHGKSIYLDQVSIGLCLESQWSFALCSPESYPMQFYFSRLIKRILGKKFSKWNITPQELSIVKLWLTDRYNLIYPPNGFDLDDILSKAKQLVLQKGIKGLIIDPWNRLEQNMPSGYNEGKWINEQLAKIISFSQRTGVHTFLVAHPTKMQKDEGGINYKVPNLYSISGSAHFFNMTHNGLTVFRNYETNMTEVHIQKVKWEHLGKIGRIDYVYNNDNARFVREGISSHDSWINVPCEPKQSIPTFQQHYETHSAQLVDDTDDVDKYFPKQ